LFRDGKQHIDLTNLQTTDAQKIRKPSQHEFDHTQHHQSDALVVTAKKGKRGVFGGDHQKTLPK
jgi:hypothetical protein